MISPFNLIISLDFGLTGGSVVSALVPRFIITGFYSNLDMETVKINRTDQRDYSRD